MADFGLTLLAVIISVLGNFINAIGYIIEKIAHKKIVAANSKLPADEQKVWYKSKLWIFGYIVYGAGSLLHAASLAFGPQSLLTPLESVTLVSNTFLAHKYLKEPLRGRDILATICVVIGASLAVIFGPRSSNDEITIGILLERYTFVPFVIFFTILSCITLTDYIIVKIVQRQNELQRRIEYRLQLQKDMRQKMHQLMIKHQLLPNPNPTSTPNLATPNQQKITSDLELSPVAITDNNHACSSSDTSSPVSHASDGELNSSNDNISNEKTLTLITNKNTNNQKTETDENNNNNNNSEENEQTPEQEQKMDVNNNNAITINENTDQNNNNSDSGNINDGSEEEEDDIRHTIYFGRTFLMISYTSIGAFFGSCNVLLMKSVAEIMSSTFSSSKSATSNWTNFFTYLLWFLFICVNIGLEYWKQKALSYFGALFVVPIYQVLVIVGGILFGAIYFEELNSMTREYLMVFFAAILLTLSGVGILASSADNKRLNKLVQTLRKKIILIRTMKAFQSVADHNHNNDSSGGSAGDENSNGNQNHNGNQTCDSPHSLSSSDSLSINSHSQSLLKS